MAWNILNMLDIVLGVLHELLNKKIFNFYNNLVVIPILLM